ncbi:MAG: class I tRNA ligase family protein, partial [Fimbriimonadales bacterium]|nr:class I tRNA ligase family protein [Fimbriimonadales bacterium]
MDFKSTLHLPDADSTIPMKANLAGLEPSIQSIWDEEAIYHKLQEVRKDSPTYVLHDGPPYTNSPIHIGTAMNKILKDFVLKSRSLMGFRTPYVPGFDNHGLPIEQAVMKKFSDKKITPTIPELREACRQHAHEYLKIQTDQFKRLGIFGLWEKPYMSMDFRFEAEIVRVFKRLVEGGYIYKGLRPTLWSPSSRTALADTEIVYNDHVSKAIYVRFPLRNDPNQLLAGLDNVYTIIWTTTPWTLPANQALNVHPEFLYSLVDVGTQLLILATDRVSFCLDSYGLTGVTLGTCLGEQLTELRFAHPLFNLDPSYARYAPVYAANYVTLDTGTGIVHDAPAYGEEDFKSCKAHGLNDSDILNPVMGNGVYASTTGIFGGQFIWKANPQIVKALDDAGSLLKSITYKHSYMHCWRHKTPIIYRATSQWFASMDKKSAGQSHSLREVALAGIESTQFYPAWGQQRLRGMIANRPDWTLSRQRQWGVPMAFFVHRETGELHPQTSLHMEQIAQLIESQGIEAWQDLDPATILLDDAPFYEKNKDTLDVWFDSGTTHW